MCYVWDLVNSWAVSWSVSWIRSQTHVRASQMSCHAKWHLMAIVIEYICIIVFCSPRTTFVVVAVSDTYQDDISDGYSIPDEKMTVGYSIPDEIPTTCFQLCELV